MMDSIITKKRWIILLILFLWLLNSDILTPSPSVTVRTIINPADSGFETLPYPLLNTHPNLMMKTVQNQNPILYIPGWTKTSYDWITMEGWFLADGWPNTSLYAYDFVDKGDSSVQGNINNANQIKQWVEEILQETGAEKIDLISHSMGGLSSRYYIKFLGGIDTVDDYVSLGAPHHGEEAGEPCIACRVGNPLLLALNEGDETPGGILNDTLGTREAPWSGIIYNGTHIDGNISYTSIYSLDDEDVPSGSCPLDGAKNISVAGLFHSQLYQDESVYELVKAAVYNPHQLSPPSLIFPIGGETLSGDTHISWIASVDTWGYNVTYNVSYSTDGGTTWILLKENLMDTSFIWDTSTVPNGSNYFLKIEAITSSELNAIFISPSPFIITNPTTTTTTTTTTKTTTTSSRETTAITPSWNTFLLFVSLFVLLLLRQRKKKS